MRSARVGQDRSLLSKHTARKRPFKRAGRRSLLLESLEARQLMAGEITGTVFNDANANGLDDSGDNGLPGWTVFVDTNRDGKLTAGEPSTVTDVKGRYALSGIPAGDVDLYGITQDSFSPTPGFSDHQSVRVRDGRETRAKFPSVTAPVTTGQIAGTVFEDNNENRVQDPGEDGLENWTLFIDTDGNGQLTAGEPTATTDTDGNFRFVGVTPGTARLYELAQAGLLPTVGGLFPRDGALEYQQVTVAAGVTSRASFGNLSPQVGTIQGTVWNDSNGDGVRGAAESPLAGESVFVDLNNNGAIDSGEPTRVTDANGEYAFTNIHTGSYRLSDVRPAGYINADGRASTVATTVFRGSLNTLDFYNLTPAVGSVSGQVWEDADGNGLRGASESRLADRQIYVDLNANGSPDAGEPQTITDASGAYSITGLNYGTLTIREVLPANWLATNPTAGAFPFHLLNGEDRGGVNFGNREQVGTLQGTVWNDANGDRLRGEAEAGLAGWTVFLDLNTDGIQDAAEPAVVTDASGAYTFGRINSGSYQVREILPEGWIVSAGKLAVVNVNLTIGGAPVVDFYNLVLQLGAISGVVWNDLDSSGTQTIEEPGMEGWQVFVDTNNNGALDAAEPSALTDLDGNYVLADVAYGNTVVQIVQQASFSATSPVAGRTSLFLLNGENRAGVSFGEHELAQYVIGGNAFFDANHNGTRDAGERGLSGITVYLDANDNGALDAGELSTVTSTDQFFTPSLNEAGNYSFTHLGRGTYHVREIVPVELDATAAQAQEHTILVAPGLVTTADFANVYRASEVHGVIFDDANTNGTYEAGEPVRAHVPVYIDLNRDDKYDDDEPRTLTGDDGAYAFVGLTPGAYVVREDSKSSPHTYPNTGGDTLWPQGVSNPSSGNVDPTSITRSLGDGESYRQTVTLTLPGGGGITNMVDVFLLFDDTGSFTTNSPIVRAAFPTIISNLQAALPGIDLGFGVGRLEEYANFAGEYQNGRPFILNQPIVTASTDGFQTAIQAALDRMAPGYGGDTPETDIEALYQMVTGLGFDGNNNGTTSDSGAAGLTATQLTPGTSGDVPSFGSFTPDAANNVLPAAGNIGGAGFRPGALPIILLATDTGFVYQPYGESVVTGAGGLTLPLSALTQSSRATTPFSYGAGLQQTITGLNALGALVIGLGTNADNVTDPRLGLESLAKLTGAVNQSTTTIANGTIDPIAPGDPLYFQIGSGFGSTVADGITNAIQNGVTTVAMDITVRASDTRVHIINHSGTALGVGAGQTAGFDVEFVGDGRPHRFDLQFVRAGTNVVLGSIPVVIGTPVAGEDYNFEELEDGEIHHSSHFGHYVTNVAPSFTAGGDVSVLEDASDQTIVWATNVSVGSPMEVGQAVNFLVANDNPTLFSTQPSIAADGSLTFTPAPNAHGTAVVTVQLRDNGGTALGGSDTSAAQTFVIGIASVNDAPVASADAYSTLEGAPLVIAASGLLTNDNDADGDALLASVVTPPAQGTLVLSHDGSFEYVPAAGFVGTDSFTYTVSDGLAASTTATVSIEVLARNHAPAATDDSYTMSEDTGITIAGVLANDTDADGNPLSAALVAGPAHGTLTLNSDGSLRYVPDANYNGTDRFTYLANDGELDSNDATVTLTIAAVNDAPVATGEEYAVNEDNSLVIAPSGLLANDSDVEVSPLTAVRVTGPAHGTLTLNANGSFVYVPVLNFNGIDSFSYRVSDGALGSNVATVTITVASVNDVPVATGDSFTTDHDTTLTIAARGVLGNDSDVDGDALSASPVSGPTHGDLLLNTDGSFTYVPAAGYSGADSFTYRASDGTAFSGVTTVSLTVTPPPPPGVKFFVVDGDTRNTHRYAPDGQPLANSALNKSDSKPRGIASNAAGTTQWVVDGGGDVFIYDNTGRTLGEWTPQNVGKPEGIAVWGSNVWVVDPVSDRVYYFAAGANLRSGRVSPTSSFPLNGANLNATDIVTEGAHLWVVNDTVATDSVFRYSTAGALEGSWTIAGGNPSPTGITLDPNNVGHLWVVDASTDRVYQYDNATSRLSGSQTANASFALGASNTNPQGIADPLSLPAVISASSSPSFESTSKSSPAPPAQESTVSPSAWHDAFDFVLGESLLHHHADNGNSWLDAREDRSSRSKLRTHGSKTVDALAADEWLANWGG
jgi:VCBS repeat-containing protein